MDFSIKQITFDDVYPIWRDKLWPNRQDAIRPVSSMLLGGGFDMDIYHLYVPIFLGLFYQGQVIGVLSGHGTGSDDFRIRGLYVEPEFRNQGGAHLLMEGLRIEAEKQRFARMWSYPKLSALPVYEKFGFKTYPSSEADPEHVYVLRKTET